MVPAKPSPLAVLRSPFALWASAQDSCNYLKIYYLINRLSEYILLQSTLVLEGERPLPYEFTFGLLSVRH